MAIKELFSYDFDYKGHNSGWFEWKPIAEIDASGKAIANKQTNFSYAAPANDAAARCVVIRFKAGIPEGYKTGKLTLKIPFVRAASGGGPSTEEYSGKLYVKLYKSDPTASAKTIADVSKIIPGPVNGYDVRNSNAWDDITDQEYFYASFEISTDCCAVGDNYTYAVFGAESLIKCGGLSKDNKNGQGRNFSGSVEYCKYGSSPTVSVIDNGDNTCTICGTFNKNAVDNDLVSVKLYYTTNGEDPKDSSSHKEADLVIADGPSYKMTFWVSKNCTVKAYIECIFKYNVTSANGQANVKYYAAPKAPGMPELHYQKSRLTVKEPWTFTWTPATPANDNSPVCGYYIMLLRKSPTDEDFDYIRNIYCRTDAPFTEYLDISPGANPDNDTNYYTYRESTSCVLRLYYPWAFGIKARDQIKLRIKPYTRNGARAVLQGEAVDSDVYLVQNAGIVNVKVNNAWAEGQVYVKVDGGWKEAETVNVKVNGSWKESQ